MLAAAPAGAVAKVIVRALQSHVRRSWPTIRRMSTSESVGSGVAPPEPELTPQEMIGRAAGMRPALVADQEATERRTYD